MNKFIIFLLFMVTLSAGCREEEPPFKEDLYPEEPLSTPSSSAINVFHQNIPNYQLFVYRYNEDTKLWSNRIIGHFSIISTQDPNYLGFVHPVATSGVTFLDMHRLYATQIGSTNAVTAKINVDKFIGFFPDFEGAKTGIVRVVPQDITVSKNPNSTFEPGVPTFKIGISGEGTYDERTAIIDLEVIFNETAIGGPAAVKRIYKMSPSALTLNL
ncbi:hypothetical protein [Pedobacter glucosidilyticus]|uniref:hypothetical protein n=1 Tax=Pedobacter glucosidilyticus TaxID=1122941 RepID=UPI0026F333AC|nr:hypothetical protein [Pedobacter glucosidilyticus]